MSKRKLSTVILILMISLVAIGKGNYSVQNGQAGDPLAGARVYDNWMTALDLAAPEADQPLWAEQEQNERTGDVTWRCKECHGWDYKGAAGAFGPDSIRYTGFPSLESSIGSSHEEVLAWLDGTNNPDHNFLEITNPNALDDLSAFLRTMQLNAALIISYDDGRSLGDAEMGQVLYVSDCADCHGELGREINFSSSGLPLFVGDIAIADPWKTVHIIRFGTPTNSMPGVEEKNWSFASIANVLAYAQGLPRGNSNFSGYQDTPVEQIDNQGDTGPLLWAVSAILLVITSGLLWEKLQEK